MGQFSACMKRVQDKVLETINKAEHVEVGITDPTIATYASYVEYGWVQRVTDKQAYWFAMQGLKNPPQVGSSLVNPPRPFFRSTLANKSNEWEAVFTAGVQRYGVLNLAPVLNLVGMQASSDIKETIISGRVGSESFEERSELTMQLYASEGAGHKQDGSGNISVTKPLVKTGAMLNAIGYQLVGGNEGNG